MKARSQAAVLLVAAVCCLSTYSFAAPLTGVDADREEARINLEFDRSVIADDYLVKLVDRLVAATPTSAGPKIRVRAVKDANPFVFALGNGATYVSTGLLARLQNDSQVAALLAPEITSVLAPNSAIEEQYLANNKKHSGAKVLAILATAGMASFPLLSSQNKAMTAHSEAVILDNDKTAIGWLRRAGFDAAQAPVATRRLKEVLTAEQQFGMSRLASAAGLERRTGQLSRALEESPPEATAAALVPDAVEPLRKISLRLSLQLADSHVDYLRPDAFRAVIERIELEYGVTADTSCRRARFARQKPSGSEVSEQVIEAYRACVAAADAPPEYSRDLGFLLRDKGDTKSATQAFEQYLKRAPGAVDAPIVKGYIEELNAKH